MEYQYLNSANNSTCYFTGKKHLNLKNNSVVTDSHTAYLATSKAPDVPRQQTDKQRKSS